jgi:tetratricopeptide (TPR) repeat protein
MKIRVAMQAGVLGTLVACGGSAPPAQTAAAPGSELDSPPATTATASAADLPQSPEDKAGRDAFDAGNYPQARASFEAAAKKNPKDAAALYNLGMTCEKLDDRPAAEQAYKNALAIRPDMDDAATALSSLYLNAGKVEDGLAVARAGLAKHPGSAQLHENLGVALAMRGDQDEALKEFEQALHAAPTDPMKHLTLAHWLNTWHLKGAVPHLDAVRNMVKDDYAMLAEVAFEYRMASDFDQCVQTYSQAVALKDGGEVRTGRALCRLGLKDEKGMLEDLEAAVATEPTYATAHYYLAGRLATAKKFKEAAAEYGKYLSLAPDGSLARQAAERQKAALEAAKATKKH